MNTKEFKEKYCKDCEAKCEKGITETKEIIYCADRDIKEDK